MALVVNSLDFSAMEQLLEQNNELKEQVRRLKRQKKALEKNHKETLEAVEKSEKRIISFIGHLHDLL